jgi:inorganic triphosphatase YgiF
MAIEVESKFRAVDQRTLQRLSTIDRLGPAWLGEARVASETDSYLDTTDGRLAAAGWACRLRSRADRAIVSLKGTAASRIGDRSGTHRRPEIEGPATAEMRPDAWPPSEATELLLALSGGARLHERLRLKQRRTERAVLLEGHRIATLSLDEVDVLDPAAGSVGRVLVVELEHAGGARDEELAAVADAVRAQPGLTPDPLTKLDHATRLIAESRAAEE